MDEQRRPEVTLIRSSAPLPVSAERVREPRRRPWLALWLTAFGLLLAGTSTGEPPPPPAPLAAELVVHPEALTVSQGGVLVLPLELRNGTGALQVAAQVYAEPVSEDAVVQAPDDLQAGAVRSFVAIVAPDCRLLRRGSPIEFRATVLLRLSRGPQSRDLVADLAGAAGVRELVTARCNPV